MKTLYFNSQLITLSCCAILLIAVMLGNAFTATVIACAVFLLGSGFKVKSVARTPKQRALTVCLAAAGAVLAVTLWMLRASGASA